LIFYGYEATDVSMRMLERAWLCSKGSLLTDSAPARLLTSIVNVLDLPFTFSNEEYVNFKFLCGFGDSNENAAFEEYRQKVLQCKIQYRLLLVLFVENCVKVAHFGVCRLLNVQCNSLWKRKKTSFKQHRAFLALEVDEFQFAPLSQLRESGKHCTTKDCIRIILIEFHNWNMGTWVGGWNFAHPHFHRYILFTDVALFT
jgi:hypothetical protein